MKASEEVNGFFGESVFLNNYYPSTVTLDGALYASVEHAYQAAKTTDTEVRQEIRSTLDPDRAKELGRANLDRSDWDEVKVAVMRQLVWEKFESPFLQEKLIDTGEARLVEGNTWGDTFWGVCDGIGQNIMGEILMEIRESLRQSHGVAKVSRVVDTSLSTTAAELVAIGYADATGEDHVALVAGNVTDKEDVMVRVHSECLTGDAFGALRCDCGDQLQMALSTIEQEGAGVVVYLRGHEGRGIGLLEKLKACSVQDTQGLDTVDANTALGLPVDARDYSAATQIIADLGVRSVRLLSNNPDKVSRLSASGMKISERIPLLADAGMDNRPYLAAKRDRLGHELPQL